jgi:hypothetical protein
VKNVVIYDPFNVLKDDMKILSLSIANVYGKNFSIALIYNNKCGFNCKTKSDINLKMSDLNSNLNDFDMIITIINFKSGNEDLINGVIYTDDINSLTHLPEEMNYLQLKSHLNNKECNEVKQYEKFYTKKNENYLPDVILFFGKEEICLYGFPFTLLENCEIIKAGALTSFDIIKYITVFEKFSKINKRFGK